jgi:plasmid stability protein
MMSYHRYRSACDDIMAAMTIRNLSEETHRALRVRAAEHGRSTEAEVRAILEEAVRPANRLRMGSALVELFRPLGGVDLQIERDRSPPRPVKFD